MPADDFFPGDKESRERRVAREHRAKSVCRRCPVMLACREYALENAEPHGIWGATTPAERRSAGTSHAQRSNAAGG
ncbi:WhiB family transcriptional regulator [Mycobacterium sp. MBM]|nr:WhiB family transcriptional regulator [Mycobacterium sp. MBM]